MFCIPGCQSYSTRTYLDSDYDKRNTSEDIMVEYDWQPGIQNIPWLWLRQTEHIWRHNGRIRLTTWNTEHTLIVINVLYSRLSVVLDHYVFRCVLFVVITIKVCSVFQVVSRTHPLCLQMCSVCRNHNQGMFCILILCTLCLRYLLSIIIASLCALFHVITHVVACRQTYLLFWHTIWKQAFPDFFILKIRYQLTNLVYSTRRNIIKKVYKYIT
jgi:hypothetical protein